MAGNDRISPQEIGAFQSHPPMASNNLALEAAGLNTFLPMTM